MYTIKGYFENGEWEILKETMTFRTSPKEDICTVYNFR